MDRILFIYHRHIIGRFGWGRLHACSHISAVPVRYEKEKASGGEQTDPFPDTGYVQQWQILGKRGYYDSRYGCIQKGTYETMKVVLNKSRRGKRNSIKPKEKRLKYNRYR